VKKPIKFNKSSKKKFFFKGYKYNPVKKKKINKILNSFIKKKIY